MNILLVIDELNRGGAETLVFDFFKYNHKYKNKNINIDLFIRKKNSDYAKYLINNYPENIYVLDRNCIIDFKFLILIRKFLKDKKYDIIHTHSSTLGLYFYFAKMGMNIFMVQTIHGFFDKRSPTGKFKLFDYLCSIFLSYTTIRTFAVSEFLKNELIKMHFPSKKIYTLYNGIDLKKFGNNKSKMKHDYNKIIFGMVGNFNMGRSHITLIDAFAKLLHDYKNIFLILAGSGELLNNIKERVSELKLSQHVQFLGKIGNVNNFLKSLDCFVYSSNNETFGISVIEALYSGVPVIVSDNGPFKEITENGKYANLFQTNNSTACYKIMRSFINSRESFLIKSKMAIEYVKENFSIEKNNTETLKNYKEILEKRGNFNNERK